MWKTLCWALGVQMYPFEFKDVFWEMEVLSDSLPSAHSLQSLSSILQPSTTASSIEADRGDEGSPTTTCSNYWQLPEPPGSGDTVDVPPLTAFLAIPKFTLYPLPTRRGVPASSHHKTSTYHPAQPFLGTWLVLPAMHLLCLLSIIRSKKKSPSEVNRPWCSSQARDMLEPASQEDKWCSSYWTCQ